MKALIIGGGIAGPAAAIALRKAGIASEVYEAYPAGADADTGAFLTLTANGQNALAAIDMEAAVADVSFPTTALRLYDSSGALVRDVPMGTNRPPSRTIRRADLSHVLRSGAIAREVPILYGKRLVSVESGSGGGVTAFFEDGTSAAGDLLIGADGTHSTVRTLIDPAAPSPRYTGLVIACGYAPAGSDPSGPDGYSMYYGSQAFLGRTRGPDGLDWWFARIPVSEADATALIADGDSGQVARFFEADNTPAAALIRTSLAPLTITESRDLPRLPTWSRDRMIVIGDAAHPVSPMTAQGASLSLEDAVILGKCLRDIASVPDALRTFEHLRRERAEQIIHYGISTENPAPPAPTPRTNRGSSPVLDHHIAWDNPDR